MYYPEKAGFHGLTDEDIRTNRIDGDTVGKWEHMPYQRWEAFKKIVQFFATTPFTSRSHQMAFLGAAPRYLSVGYLDKKGYDFLLILAEEDHLEVSFVRETEVVFKETFSYNNWIYHSKLLDLADIITEDGWAE